MENTDSSNNKKRERKEIQDENEIITYKKFKNDIGSELSTIKYKELQSIAGSLGLSKNGKKEVLYKNIENHLLILESPIKQTKDDDDDDDETITTNVEEEINPFNKHQPELLIKEGIEPIELPFWKVFRNKTIFINIFSNFKYNRMKSYYDLECNYDFFKNYSNSMNIIIDNIKSKNNFYQIINKTKHIEMILSNITNDNQETDSFYNLLFSTFSSTSTSSTIELNNDIEKWISNMIINSNLVALKQYIKYFNIDKKVILECIKSKFSVGKSYGGIYIEKKKKLKMLIFLIENEYISSQESNYSQFIDEYIKQLFGTRFNVEYNLKTLIKISKLIISIYQKYNGCIKKIENRETLEKLILEINEINVNINQYFTNDQLNSTIINYINSNMCRTTSVEESIKPIQNKEIIYKYYKSIILFDNDERELNS